MTPELRKEIDEIIRKAGDPPIGDEEPYIDASRIAEEFLALVDRERRKAVEEAAQRLQRCSPSDYFIPDYPGITREELYMKACLLTVVDSMFPPPPSP